MTDERSRPPSPRMEREARTVEAMIRLYCRKRHAAEGVCAECAELLEYARERLRRCPFQEGKTACGKCPVHCYRPALRERVRVVMRYAGPLMLWHHPLLALHHLLDGRRSEPLRKIEGGGP